MTRLLDVLRHDLRLTGTKEGCGEGECGACAVLVDDELVNSCLVPVLQVEGSSIRTIESLGDGPLYVSESALGIPGDRQGSCCHSCGGVDVRVGVADSPDSDDPDEQ